MVMMALLTLGTIQRTLMAFKATRIALLEALAKLAQWNDDTEQVITHLEGAATLAREIGLPGEEWPILGVLGSLYASQGDHAAEQQARQASAAILLDLANRDDEQELHAGFLAAGVVRQILDVD
jgi:hypothetical protein